MKLAHTIVETRRVLADARAAGRPLALVPTMGALHAGHESLIRAARSGQGEPFVVVSLFVNPTQFGPGEDFHAYPRTLDADQQRCGDLGVDLLFAPPATEMYPAGVEPHTWVRPPASLTETLCGRNRPGHFDGVCTVVTKLFHIVQPDLAYFGQKDFQQATILRRMVRDLDFPVDLRICPTVREEDGLARSSRNAYLSPDHRRQAPSLYAALQLAESIIRRDTPPADTVRQAVREHLARHAPAGEIEYVQFVDPQTLADVATTDPPLVVALAVRFGSARLIDNLPIPR